MSVRHFSGHRLWRLSFLLFGHPQWRPLLFHFMFSHHFSGRRLWRLSFLYCHRIFIKFGRRQWGPFCVHTHIHIPFDFIASFLWAPPVATQFSVVWAPPVASHRFSGRRLWRLSFLSCHRIHTYLAHNDLIRKTLDLPGSFWLEPENTSVHKRCECPCALLIDHIRQRGQNLF